MDNKKIDEVFPKSHYIRVEMDHPLIKWFENEEKVALPENLNFIFMSVNEDELYFIFDCENKEIQSIESNSREFDTKISVLVNFGNYENIHKFRYNIFQIFLVGEDQKLDDKVCKKLKESTNATRKIFLRSKDLSVKDQDLFLLPFWFDSQHEPGVFKRESMPGLEHIPYFLLKKVESGHQFNYSEIKQVKEWLEE